MLTFAKCVPAKIQWYGMATHLAAKIQNSVKDKCFCFAENSKYVRTHSSEIRGLPQQNVPVKRFKISYILCTIREPI